MQTDFDDIRFTDENGSTLINYWLETKTDSTEATFWVKVPIISASSNRTIYMYYGNSTESSLSNGDNTFDFFDADFSSLITESGIHGLDNAITYQTTPTYDGSGQAIHPDVVYFPNGWHGYNYWMAMTPYPGNDASKENPSILVSNDGSTWGVPPGLTNPIDATPASGHNSDTELFYDSNTNQLWVYYMQDDGTANNLLLRRTSSDGINWNAEESILSLPHYQLASQTLLKRGSTYYMWYVDAGANGCSGRTSLKYRTSSDGVTWTEAQTASLIQPNYDIWHINIEWISSRNEYWMLYSAYPNWSGCSDTVNFFARSSDGINWTTYDSKILINKSSSWDNTQIYRGAFLYDDTNDLLKIWYSAKGTSNGWHTAYLETTYTILNNYLTSSLNGKWITYKQGSTLATAEADGNGNLHLAGKPNTVSSGNVKTANATFTNNVIIELKQNIDDEHYGDVALGTGSIQASNGDTSSWHHTSLGNGYMWAVQSPISGGSSLYLMKTPEHTTYSILATKTGGSLTTLNDWHRIKYIYTSDGTVSWYHDGTSWLTATDTSYANTSKHLLLSQGEYSSGLGGNRYIDWIFVRKYTSVEPSVSFGSEVRIYTSTIPTINPTSAYAQDFTSLSGFSETATKNGGQIQYQVSNNSGTTWYWYNFGWTTTTSGYTEANTASDINTNISTFPVGSGSFLFKAYLHSDGSQLIQLDSVNLTYVNDTTAPAGAPVCNGTAPGGAPWLYNALSESKDSIRIYFTDAKDPVDKYVLEYGTASGKYQYSSQNIGGKGVKTYLVEGLSSGTTYYFRVRAGNGCATGSWSNEISAKTKSLTLLTTEEKEEIEKLEPGEKEEISREEKEVEETPEAAKPEKILLARTLERLSMFLKNTGAGIGNFAGNVFRYTKETVASGYKTLAQGIKKPKEFVSRYTEWISYSAVSFREIVLDKEPTNISNVKVEKLTSTSAVIYWKTNHLSDSKVNWGETLDYGKTVQLDEKVHEHRIEVTGLEPESKYYYEVMSQNKNYVYDANHEFTTPKE